MKKISAHGFSSDISPEIDLPPPQRTDKTLPPPAPAATPPGHTTEPSGGVRKGVSATPAGGGWS